MGVLACSRMGCENIMCDHYSDVYGYICNECLNELKENGFCNIDDFMQTEKDNKRPLATAFWEGFIDSQFSSRR